MSLHAPVSTGELHGGIRPEPDPPPGPTRRRIPARWLVVAALVGAGAAFLASARTADGAVVGLLLVGTGGALLARLRARLPLLAAAVLLAGCAPLLIAGQDAAAERLGELAFLVAAGGVALAIGVRVPRDEYRDTDVAEAPRADRMLLLLGLGTLALVPLTWLGAGEMVNGGDTNYPLRAVEYVELRLSGWNWQIGAGVPNLPNLGTLSWSLLAWAFETLSGSPEGGQRVMLALWFAAVPASFLFLMRTVTGRWRFAFLAGALVYALNPYFANAWSNILVSTVGAAVATPLLLALGIRLAPRAARPPAWLFVVWGLAALLLSLVSQSPQLLAVVVLVVAAGVSSLGRPLDWGRAALLTAIALAVNSYWLLPQLAFLLRTEGLVSTRSLETLGLTHWTTGISANTSLLNVLRSAGSWDWFESWQGEPYVSYADLFLEHPLWVAVGLAVPAAAFATLALRPSRVAIFFGSVTLGGIALGAGLHPPFGFLYGWAMDNVPLFGIFRSPWYKFGLAVALGYGVLVALGLARVLDWTTGRLRRTGAPPPRAVPVLLGTVPCLAALVLGWPLVSGEVLLPDRESPPGFRVRVPAHVTAAADWLRREHPGARVLWLPRNSDVYRWGIATSPQPLLSYASDASVVGEIPFSSSTAPDRSIAVYLLDLFDQGRIVEALRVARLLGVGFVVTRGDVDESFYGPSPESPAYLRRALAAVPALRHARRFGPWTFYALDPPPPRVYGTRAGFVVPGGERAPARFATFSFPSAVTLVAETDAARSGSDVRALLSGSLGPRAGESTGRRFAVLKVVSSRYRIRFVDRASVEVERVAQRIRVGASSVVIPSQHHGRLELGTRGRPLTVFVDGRPAPAGGTWYLGPGAHVVSGLEPISGNLVENGSFEAGRWMDALDAGPPPGAAPRAGTREATQVLGGTTGRHSLQLLSTGNRAAVFSRVDSKAAGRSYSIEFDYRHLGGRPGSFALVTEGRTLLEEFLPRSAGWSKRTLRFDVPRDATTLDIYLYANSAGERSLMQFDSVRVRRLGRRGGASFSLQPVVRLLPLEGGSTPSPTRVEAEVVSPNLVDDPSFERTAWIGPIDAGPPRDFPGSVRGEQTARRVPGGTDGRSALALSSTGNRAGVYTRIAERAGGISYRVSFDYRLVEGRAPSFALVTEGRTLVESTLRSRRRWARHSVTFHAPADATTLDLYLYTTSAGERSTTLFDSVEVVQLGGRVESILANAPGGTERPVGLTFERISPTHYRVRVRRGAGPFLLNLRENYDEGWKASSDDAVLGTHFRSSGYANAWVVRRADPDAVIELVYRPQRWVTAGRAGTAAAFAALVVGALGVALRRRRARHQR